MKSLCVPVCFLATACLSFSVMKAAEPPAEKIVWNNPQTFTEPGLGHHSFSSAAMGKEIGYSVWLPPGYESSSERYPVIYFLHGTGGTESADAPAFSHLIAELVTKNKIPGLICVFPNGGKSGYRDHPEEKINVETMLIRELIPLIDKTYRTRADRSSRVLGGFSMGGGGAVRLALRYPEMFSAAASWAGAFARHSDGKFIPDFAVENPQPGKSVRLLLIVGYEDLTYPWHAPALEALQAAKYPFTFHTLNGVGHELGKYYDLTGTELIGFLSEDFSISPKN